MQSSSDKPSDDEGIKSLLQEALQSNQTLQTELRTCLRVLHQKKAENRKEYHSALHNLIQREGSYSSHHNTPPAHKRTWLRRYFIDSKLSVPEPNADTLRRQRWEGEEDLPALTRPWSKAEFTLLGKNADIVSRQQIEQSTDTDASIQEENSLIREPDIDFDRVALLIRQEMNTKKTRKKNVETTVEDSDEDGPSLRTCTDYRNKYLTTLSPSLNNTAFTKAESMKILEMVHRAGGHPRWDEVAQSLNTHRSPFACFRQYQIKLNNNTVATTAIQPLEESSSSLALSVPSTWSYMEDELLLKYIAASGPQTFLNQRFAADLGVRFFPHMTVKQIVLRMSNTLLIPTLKNERWSDSEERKLALCMRMYSHATSPENEAQVHFPTRAAKSVFEKWTRGLNPEFSTQPFTPQEDKALLEAVEKMGGAAHWKAVSSQFPHRNPRSLLYRWTCIAPKEEVLKRHEESFIVKTVAKRGMVGYGGGEDDDDHLDLDEFVVCARKRRKDS